MRLIRRARMSLVAMTAVAALATMPGTAPASSTGIVTGSCDLVTVKTAPYKERTRLVTVDGGTCLVTAYTGVDVVANAVQVARIELSSSNVSLVCSGDAVRGVTGSVTFTVRGNSTVSFADVNLVLDGASGSQTLNPTATVVVQGTRLAGVGTFSRSGSGDCGDRTATWTFGHLTFEDPTL